MSLSSFPARVVLSPRPVDSEEADAPLPTESLYGRLSRECLVRPLADEELALLLNDLGPGQSPLSVRGSTGASLAKRLGWRNLAELHVAAGNAPNQLAAGKLLERSCIRYCSACISGGFHSWVFQHYAMSRCPIHGYPVTCRCNCCHEPMKVTLGGIAKDPFACPRCSYLLFRAATSRKRQAETAVLPMLLEDYARDLGLLHCALTVPTGVAESRPAYAVDLAGLPHAVGARHAKRWAAWAPCESPRWPRFRNRTLDLPQWEQKDGTKAGIFAGRLTEMAGTRALQHLRAICSADHGKSYRTLLSRVRLRSDGLRFDGRSTAVAAALHLTACAYGRIDGYEQLQWECVHWNGLQQGCLLPGDDAGNALLLYYEILGWFAVCLLHVRRLCYLIDVGWIQRFDLRSFAPAWRLARQDCGWALLVRPRVDEALVSALIERYKYRRLTKLPTHHANGPLSNARATTNGSNASAKAPAAGTAHLPTMTSEHRRWLQANLIFHEAGESVPATSPKDGLKPHHVEPP